jgi:hypothetical protein
MARPYDAHGLLKSFDKQLDSGNSSPSAETPSAADKAPDANPTTNEKK